MLNPFRPISISISPNILPGYLGVVGEQLLTPAKWQGGESVSELERQFARRQGGGEAIGFSSGRSSLWAILRAISLKRNEQVLMQAYTCVAVPEPVLALGGQPVFVDIEPDTFNMDPEDLERKITPAARVLIIQHTFGLPAPVESLLAIARRNNLLVIEDCAHSLGAELNQQPTGNSGRVSFFSFGRDKVISSVYGGLVFTRDPELAEKIRTIQKELPWPGRRWILKQLLQPFITEAALSTYRLFNLGKIILYSSQKIGLASKAVAAVEWRGKLPAYFPSRLPNALAALAMDQLKELTSMQDHRRRLAEYYFSALKRLPLTLPRIPAGSQPAWLRFPVRTPKALTILRYAQKRGVLLGEWYRHIIDPKEVDLTTVGYRRGSCPTAEKVARQSLNLPTHPRLKTADARFVVELLKQVLTSNF